jgi:hypothetical protein
MYYLYTCTMCYMFLYTCTTCMCYMYYLYTCTICYMFNLYTCTTCMCYMYIYYLSTCTLYYLQVSSSGQDMFVICLDAKYRSGVSPENSSAGEGGSCPHSDCAVVGPGHPGNRNIAIQFFSLIYNST